MMSPAPVTIRAQLHWAKQALDQVTTVPMLEAELLLSHVLQVSREYLYTRQDELLLATASDTLSALIKRRELGEPIAYILGKKEFWSLNLMINSHVLIPRPETEELVASVLKYRGHHPLQKVADLGTGSGAIALALASERPHWQMVATDQSLPALQLAEQNARALSLSNIMFCEGDWCAALPDQEFDILVSNPPYIAENEWQDYAKGLLYEPISALLSGKDGLDAIRHLIPQAKNYLKPGGCLFIEHGFSQGAEVRRLFQMADYHSIESILDMAGHERITWGVFSSFL